MKRIIFLATIIALTLSIGCFDDSPPIITYTAATPREAAENLKESLDTRNIDMYSPCLTDDYTFKFQPADVGIQVDSGYVIPESWTYTEDYAATQRMFNKTYSISFDIATNEIGSPEGDATEYTELNVPISFLVMVTETDGLLASGAVTIAFTKIQNGGTYSWKISEIIDHTELTKGTESATLGQIKATFYPPPTQ